MRWHLRTGWAHPHVPYIVNIAVPSIPSTVFSFLTFLFIHAARLCSNYFSTLWYSISFWQVHFRTFERQCLIPAHSTSLAHDYAILKPMIYCLHILFG